MLGSLFNGLDSSFGSSFDLTVYATFPPTRVAVVPTGWSVHATLLNTPIDSESGGNQVSLDGAPITVSADLNARFPVLDHRDAFRTTTSSI